MTTLYHHGKKSAKQDSPNKTDLDALLAEQLTRVVQETLQPEHVSVWLKERTR